MSVCVVELCVVVITVLRVASDNKLVAYFVIMFTSLESRVLRVGFLSLKHLYLFCGLINT